MNGLSLKELSDALLKMGPKKLQVLIKFRTKVTRRIAGQ